MKKNYFLAVFLLMFSVSGFPQSLVNTSHLDHLYEKVVVNGDTMGIIHIYSEYPDYKWVNDEDEGTACIDDGARALIFYLGYYERTGDTSGLDKARRLLNFIFYMHAGNGFFYNFIWKDYTINKEFRTSQAIPNWWSWRALWALAEAGKYFKKKDPLLYSEIKKHIQKLLDVSSVIWDKPELYKEYSGFRLPAWLPYETASDQAALIIKGLSVYYTIENDPGLIKIIRNLAYGVLKMQQGGISELPYFAFLSWENTWHAWGNSQAEALLMAGKILKDSTLVNAALNEVRNFYPYLIKKSYLSDFSLKREKDQNVFDKISPFPQIAYGFSPLILNSICAYEATGDRLYLETAATVGCWFLSCNLSDAKMYSPKTGVCYDGLLEGKINMNSGAESTIETLLALLKIESIPELKAELYYKVNND